MRTEIRIVLVCFTFIVLAGVQAVEAPSIAANPVPLHQSVNNEIDSDLAWSFDGLEHIQNGGFETGDFSGWTIANAGAGDFILNDGTIDPLGPEPKSAPLSGKFNALSQPAGAGQHVLRQTVAIPASAVQATLYWSDRIRNHASQFSTQQSFRVEIQDAAGIVLATAFATESGDPLLRERTARRFDLAPFAGRNIQIAFVEQDTAGFLNVHLDDVSVRTVDNSRLQFDVYFGTQTPVGPSQLAGTTTNNFWTLPRLIPDTTYFWQIVARSGAEALPGPVWHFQTKPAGPVASFTWSNVPTPQLAGEPFPVSIRALDAQGEVATGFNSSVILRAPIGASSLPLSITNAYFDSGQWRGDIAVLQNGSNVVLHAVHRDGPNGVSQPFDVVRSPQLALNIPAIAHEQPGGQTWTGEIVLPNALATSLAIALRSSDSKEVFVPETLLIPAGALRATFDLVVRDDLVLNGTRTVTIAASAARHSAAEAVLEVIDNEPATLALTLPATFQEGSGLSMGVARISVNPTPARNLTFKVTSSDPASVLVPDTVTVVAGQSFAAFDLGLPDNNQIDGSRQVTITALNSSWPEFNAPIVVSDNEQTTLTLLLPARVSEGDGTLLGKGHVFLDGTMARDLTIQLSSSDATELVVPRTVLIPQGQVSASFDLTVMNDNEFDGTPSIRISASAPGFSMGTGSVVVSDDELHHFDFERVGDPQLAGSAFAVAIRARNVAGDLISSFNGPAQLSATGSRGLLPMLPSEELVFRSGKWTGAVTVLVANADVRLTAIHPSGAKGVSNPFQVASPQVRELQLETTDIIYSRFDGNIYASVPGSAGPIGNSIVRIDPLTGAVGKPVFIGSNPGQLAASADGRFLYVVLDGISAIRRFDVEKQIAGPQFPLDGDGSVLDLKVAPHDPNMLAVCRSFARLELYVSGNRLGITPEHVGLVAFNDAGTVLYGVNNQTTEHGFQRFTVTTNGLAHMETTLQLITVFLSQMEFSKGRIYTGHGKVIDPDMRKVLGSFSAMGHRPWVAANPAINRVYFLDSPEWNSAGIKSFAADTYRLAGTRTIGGVKGSPSRLLTWGNMGLAFRTDNGQLFVIRDQLVPSEPPADLELSVNDSVDPAAVGEPLRYSITAANRGPNPARDVIVTHRLPANIHFVSVRGPATCVHSNGIVTCKIGNLAKEQSVILTIDVEPGRRGLANNVTTISSANLDPNSSNDIALTFTSIGFKNAPDTINLLNVRTTGLVYDATRQKLFASVPESVEAFGNSILAMDPATGNVAVLTSLPLPPGQLAISDDGSFLYAAGNSPAVVQRVNLATGKKDLEIRLESDAWIEDLEVLPRRPESIAISRRFRSPGPSRSAMLSIFDRDVKRSVDSAPHQSVNVFEFASADVIYGYDRETPGYELRRLLVGPDGLWVQESHSNLLRGEVDFQIAEGLLFSSDGRVIDLAAKALLGSFPAFGARSTVSPDVQVGRAFIVDGSELRAFDIAQFYLAGSLPLPSYPANTTSLFRWGDDGLAFADDAQVFVLRTALVNDADRDLLPDHWEKDMFGSLDAATASGDLDRDGLSNLQEFHAGTDPTRAASVLRVVDIHRTAGAIEISFSTSAHRTYRIESAPDLTAARWTAISADVIGTGSTVRVSLQDPAPSARFFRIHMVSSGSD